MSTGLYSGVSGLALGVGLYKGVPGLWGGASGLITGDGSSLSLDFLTSNTLDPRITFSRTTNATLVDNTGRVTYAPNNLLLRSEEFNNGVWSKVGVVTANATTAPNGTTTADSAATDGSNAQVAQGVVIASGATMVGSMYLKPNGLNAVEIVLLAANNTTPYARATFNVATGVISVAVATANGGTNASAAIAPAGNGWYRCSVTVTYPATTSAGMRINAAGATGAFYGWGAQFEAVTYQTLPSTYNSTSPPNLFGFTEEFNNAYWTKAGATVSPDATAAPNGSTTADKLVEDSSTGQHRFYGTAASTTNTGSYTVSFFAKAAERTRVYVGVAESPTFVRQGNAVFDLSAGTVVSANAGSGGASGGSATIQDAGNGWYRCSYTLILGGANTSIFVDFNLVSTGTTISYTGNGTSGLFLWGAQLSNSASVDPYVYNPGAAPTSTAYYGPRFDYNPVTLAPNGLLIEEQRVNLVLYSQQLDDPTWVKSAVTVSANVGVAPDGTTTADKVIPAISAVAFKELQQNFSSTLGVNYAFSCYVKDAGYRYIQLIGTAGQFGTFAINYDLQTGTETAFTAGTSTVVNRSITSVGNGWYRVSVVLTAIGTSASARIGINVIPASDSARGVSWASDGTSGILQWGAQTEAGAFATSYIPTVASTVTRAADVASMTGTNFSSWYNQSEGTIVSQFVATTNGINSTGGNDFPFVYDIDSAAATNSGHQLLLSAGYGPGWTAQTSILGVPQAVFGAAMPLGNASVRKIAYAYQTNNFAASANGGTVLTDTSGTLPSPDRMSIGNQNAVASNVFTGYIRTITYYSSRLTNAQLQALTA